MPNPEYPRLSGNMLEIDEKWGIVFDPENNDRPQYWTRYTEPVVSRLSGRITLPSWEENNSTTAMFYCLLSVAQSK